ncbi:MAG: hypothetical protein P0S95_04865 [Rhabdochlamydiaceae bacterium]|nr:hypothetical protein [Candidatus Amphrikana amoebophyrae]
MTIIDIEEFREKEGKFKNQSRDPYVTPQDISSEYIRDQLRSFSMKKPVEKKRFLASLATRLLFLLLLAVDALWFVYSVVLFSVKLALNIGTFFSLPLFRGSLSYSWLSIKRSLIGFISLFLALFSPALGFMFACLYFLMYDKNGVEEIVPKSLKDQFKDFFPS